MSSEELNLKLYQKMVQEQEKYGDWLKSQSPDVQMEIKHIPQKKSREAER